MLPCGCVRESVNLVWLRVQPSVSGGRANVKLHAARESWQATRDATSRHFALLSLRTICTLYASLKLQTWGTSRAKIIVPNNLIYFQSLYDKIFL